MNEKINSNKKSKLCKTHPSRSSALEPRRKQTAINPELEARCNRPFLEMVDTFLFEDSVSGTAAAVRRLQKKNFKKPLLANSNELAKDHHNTPLYPSQPLPPPVLPMAPRTCRGCHLFSSGRQLEHRVAELGKF